MEPTTNVPVHATNEEQVMIATPVSWSPVTSTCLLGLSLLCLACNGTPSRDISKVTIMDEDEQLESYIAQLQEYIRVGENRPFSASGPKFQLPSHYFEFAKERPESSLRLVKEKLASPDANIRCNAYDFLVHLAEVSAVRGRAIEILRRAVTEEGFAIQTYVRPALDRLTCHATATSSTAH